MYVYKINCHFKYLKHPSFSIDRKKYRMEVIVIDMKVIVDFHKRESRAIFHLRWHG